MTSGSSLREQDPSLVVINTLEANISYLQIENSFPKCILLHMHLPLLGAGSKISGILYLFICQTFLFNFFGHLRTYLLHK